MNCISGAAKEFPSEKGKPGRWTGPRSGLGQRRDGCRDGAQRFRAREHEVREAGDLNVHLIQPLLNACRCVHLGRIWKFKEMIPFIALSLFCFSQNKSTLLQSSREEGREVTTAGLGPGSGRPGPSFSGEADSGVRSNPEKGSLWRQNAVPRGTELLLGVESRALISTRCLPEVRDAQ